MLEILGNDGKLPGDMHNFSQSAFSNTCRTNLLLSDIQLMSSNKMNSLVSSHTFSLISLSVGTSIITSSYLHIYQPHYILQVKVCDFFGYYSKTNRLSQSAHNNQGRRVALC